jgi:hypothetical protein
MAAQLDHLVIDVRDRMEAEAERWRRLGFQLTPRGRHSLGSVNHLMILGTDYLELLGWEGGPAPRPELAASPPGMNGLVFRCRGAAATHAAMLAVGVAVQEPRSFTRPVTLADGSSLGEARFTTTRLVPGTGIDGRIYFCEHHTPELVWREEWRAHPNTALAVSRVVIAAAEPARPSGVLGAMFGAVPAPVAVLPQAALGALLPEPAGRRDFLALVGLRVASLAACAAALEAGGVPYARDGGTLRVAPAEAGNVALEFSE